MIFLRSWGLLLCGIEEYVSFDYIHHMNRQLPTCRQTCACLCVILVLLLFGCSERTRTIVVAVDAIPEQIDPVKSIDLDGRRIAVHVYESLFALGEMGEIIPRLARGFEYDTTRMILTIHLRDDVLFHDGIPMTAEDVFLSLQRIVAAAEDTLVHMGVSPGLLGNPREIRVVDTLTLEIILPAPHQALLELLATPLYTPIIRYDSLTGTEGSNPIGTGQYFVKKYSSGKGQVVLRRFEQYWGEPPIPDEIRFTAFDDGVVRLDAIKTGRADVAMNISITSISSVTDSELLDMVTSSKRGWMVVGINNQQPPFDDVEMRRALVQAIDTDQITRDRWPGAGAATPYFVAENLQPDLKGRAAPGFDPEAAQVRFDSESLSGRIPLVLIRGGPPADQVRTEALLDLLKSSLGVFGFELIQKYYPDWDEFDRQVRNGDWNLSLDGFSPDNADLFRFLQDVYGTENPDGSYGIFRINGNGFIELLARANSSLDEDERLELFGEAIECIADQIPCVPLANIEVFLVHSASLLNLRPGPYPDWTFARVSRADWK
ncbi:ABC transporter substrate-binding protein [Gemmatimonadota bacterium]